MINYSSVIYGAMGYLGKAAIVIGAFRVGRSSATHEDDNGIKNGTKSPRWREALSLLGVIAIFSAILGSSLGTHTEDADPLYGGGETVIDFQTTEKQQLEYALTMFITLSISALYGLYGGREKK